MSQMKADGMHVLDRTRRNKLERTVMEAREVAVVAARAAIEQLAVGEGKPATVPSAEEKELRRKLRAHGRQLGDARNTKTEAQEIENLVEEVAYEHWHRMLFARFLAENNLLMYPDPDAPVPVSLAECEDLAAEFGAKNGWELASRFAARMLPQIFRPESPVFAVTLPPEYQQKLEQFVAGLEGAIFTSSDSLGWVYQFWQAKNKDAVNDSEVKIGARELPAVTQLFTEPYMVAFLLDNSLGAWWAARRLAPEDLRNAQTEEELRTKVALPTMPLDYLRFVRQEDGVWTLAAGTFAGWPHEMPALKVLDPCCGSGHFLVAAFLMLVAMRTADEGLSVQAAADAVLRENLHGLEIDRRCTEIAAFNLALNAWRLSGYRLLPTPQIACSGLAVGGTREQWMEIISGQPVGQNVRFFFGQLYDLFSKAPTLGSLINPHRFLGSGWLSERDIASLQSTLALAMADEARAVTERSEMGVTALGVAKAADLLAGTYTLVATNVPYLGRGKQDEVLREYLERQYPLGKADLATAVVLRCLEFCDKGGTTALVTPQSWLFLGTYSKLRELLLGNRTWNLVARLGAKAFQTPMWDFNIQLGIVTASVPADSQMMAGVDVSAAKEPEGKAAMLRGAQPATIVLLQQSEQLNNPDAVVAMESKANLPLLSTFAECLVGMQSSDDSMFLVAFWELEFINRDTWELMQATPDSFTEFDGMSWAVRWEQGQGLLFSLPTAYPTKGLKALGKAGIAIHRMGKLFAYHYGGQRFHQNVATIIPYTTNHLSAIWCFCTSTEFERAVRKLDQSLKVTNATLVKVPFDLDRWQSIAAQNYPNGLPEPESDDPTQWLFHGRAEHATAPLQVAVSRLLGYRWPAELDETMRLSGRARALVKSCDALLPFADKDGIVCIPPVRGEASAQDRILNLLAAAYGELWSSDVLSNLLKHAGFTGKSLESWLRDGFFSDHCEMFHDRPFIWQIWDGLRDGFSAMVNYHMLDRKNLETLIYTYLGDWIQRQKDDKASSIDGAQERLDAAEALQKRLELILHGESPYDIFVRWKPIEKQAIGWSPDLNDGVRMNIRPFLRVPDVRVKDAGVLRVKPRIKWDKDRGKEPERSVWEFPWFWGWDGSVDFAGGDTFTGDRVNDCHYTLAFKRQARLQANEQKEI
jgi:hypothetical protein